jgi:predicted lysophospholipase L1 biosynthesis ABC-type transport system permease subunit
MSRTSMLLAAYNLHTSQRARALDQVVQKTLGSHVSRAATTADQR